MDRIFADFGVPDQLKADNGPQFASAEFRAFCERKGVRLVTSSPEHPMSNGLAERFVQTVKNAITKMLRDGRTVWDAIAAVRSTPVSDSLPSPAVLLQGRHLRTDLAMVPSQLKPKVIPPEVVLRQLQKRQETTELNNSHSPSERSSALVVGQRVRAYVSESWRAGVIERICQEPNSYVIKLQDGRIIRRTRQAINLDKSRSERDCPATSSSQQCLPQHRAPVAVAVQPERPIIRPVVPVPEANLAPTSPPAVREQPAARRMSASPFHGWSPRPAQASPANHHDPVGPAATTDAPAGTPRRPGTSRSGRTIKEPSRLGFD